MRLTLGIFSMATVTLCGIVLALMVPVGRWSGTADALTSFLPVAAVLGVLGLMSAAALRRRLFVLVNAVTLGISAVVVVPELLAARAVEEPAAAPAPTVTIVTHNLLKANRDPAGTLAALAASDADILLLQEARGAVGRSLPSLYARYPYHSRCAGDCDLAILSRLPLDRPRWKLRRPDGSSYGPPLLWARVKPPFGKPFVVIAIHLPWPLPAQAQAEARRSLVEALGTTDMRRTVLAGDFNLTPWGAAMRQLDDGLPPLRRVTHGIATWPSRWREWDIPFPLLPIDQIFVGPAWQVASLERLNATGSDHYPLRIRIAPVEAPAD